MSSTTSATEVTTGQPFSARRFFEEVGTPLRHNEQHPVEFFVGVRPETPENEGVPHLAFCSVVPVRNFRWLNWHGPGEPLVYGDKELADSVQNPVIFGDGLLRRPIGSDGAALLHYFGLVSLDPQTGGIVLSKPLAAEILPLDGIEFCDDVLEHVSVYAGATAYCSQKGMHNYLNTRGQFRPTVGNLLHLFDRRGSIVQRAKGRFVRLPQGAVSHRDLGIPARLRQLTYN